MPIDDYFEEVLPPVFSRLYNGKEDNEKPHEDVLITTLSTDTVRWIKQRRTTAANHRVAITHFRESQLREIFDGLDFDSTSIIDLEELKKAVKYAEEELKGKRGPSFKNVEKMFEAMDEDGNGEVDYHEFMVSMTGSAKSLFDTASEADIEKLRTKFVEYAFKKKREHFVRAIEDKPMNHQATSPDLEKCKYFQELFSIGIRAEFSHHHEEKKTDKKSTKKTADKKSADKKVLMNRWDDKSHGQVVSAFDKTEEIMDEFTGLKKQAAASTGESSGGDGESPAVTGREKFYLELEARIKEQRRKDYESMTRDAESRDVERRVTDERKYIQKCRQQSRNIGDRVNPKRPASPNSKAGHPTHHIALPLPTLLPDSKLSIRQQQELKRRAQKDARELWKRPASAALEYALDLTPRFPNDFHFSPTRKELEGLEGFDDLSCHDSLDRKYTGKKTNNNGVKLHGLSHPPKPTATRSAMPNSSRADLPTGMDELNVEAHIFEFDTPQERLLLQKSFRQSNSQPSFLSPKQSRQLSLSRSNNALGIASRPDSQKSIARNTDEVSIPSQISVPKITISGGGNSSKPKQVLSIKTPTSTTPCPTTSTQPQEMFIVERPLVLKKMAKRNGIAAQISQLSAKL